MKDFERKAAVDKWADNNRVYGAEREILWRTMERLRSEAEKGAEAMSKAFPGTGYSAHYVRDQSMEIADTALFANAIFGEEYRKIRANIVGFFMEGDKRPSP